MVSLYAYSKMPIIRTRLVPSAFNPVLAQSLNNLSNHLSDLGHQEEAIQATQDAHAYACEL